MDNVQGFRRIGRTETRQMQNDGLTVGIILAGGASSRMGSPKALVMLPDGETFLSKVAGAMMRGGCDAVLCVAGCHAPEIATALPDGVMMVLNPDWRKGQLESVRRGLSAALSLKPGRILLHVVDQPLLTSDDVRALLDAFSPETDAASPLSVACHRGVRGHPIALTPEAAQAVLTDTSSATLRQSLEKACPSPTIVECSSGCVRGANTPEELKLLGAPFL